MRTVRFAGATRGLGGSKAPGSAIWVATAAEAGSGPEMIRRMMKGAVIMRTTGTTATNPPGPAHAQETGMFARTTRGAGRRGAGLIMCWARQAREARRGPRGPAPALLEL
jgi:hypothetical protein